MKDNIKRLRTRDVQDTIDLIGGRWRGAIMASLCGSPKRFSEIKVDLEPITARVLTKELRYLETNKMIERLEGNIANNSVQYITTEHGKSIEPLIIHIQEWALTHRETLLHKNKDKDNNL
ncbi:winged helix-turn-helix transcriptional regulator [Pedobacter mucosus]|uniref:winged helix-turn-helix transcriptional regulator n=1 Tax=Pedobacter mucosus TaxID=2895286 RepID=UPI001EE4A951|nr:helix-turn-helix domain-containing protein [Pedobacter mucosus]UKT63030.1 helix-turn-helix transcriptional regulator [Pedobacter mucosus]